MEPFIAALIHNPHMPKWLRCAIVALVCGLVILLGVMLALKSPMLVGRLFGGVLAAAFLAAAIWLFVKIAQSKSA